MLSLSKKRAAGHPITGFSLLYEEGDRKDIYEVSPDGGCSEVKSAPQSGYLISLSEHDHKFNAVVASGKKTRRLPNRQIHTMAMSACNGSYRSYENKRLGTIYCTPKTRMDDMPPGLKVIPFDLVAQMFVGKVDIPKGEEGIFVINLTDEIDKPSILVHVKRDGMVSDKYIFARRKDDNQRMIESMLRELQIKSTDDQNKHYVFEFSIDDIREVLPTLGYYPLSDVILGVPLDLGQTILAVASVLIALTIGLVCLALAFLTEKNKQEIAEQQKVIQVTQKTAIDLIISRPDLLIEMDSVDANYGVDKAIDLYVYPGISKLFLGKESARVDISFPFGRIVNNQEIDTATLLSKTVEGCQKISIETNSNVNEMKVKYECKKNNAGNVYRAIHAFRNQNS